IQRVRVGEPDTERERRRLLRQSRREALEDAHVVGLQAFGHQLFGVVGKRPGGQFRVCRRESYTVRASLARRVQEVDGVDTVAAAALCVVNDVARDGQTTEVCVLADLVHLVAELGDV